RAIDIIGTPPVVLPDLQVVLVTTDATGADPASAQKPLTVTWTVNNYGDALSIGSGDTWADSVDQHDAPGVQRAGPLVWHLGTFVHAVGAGLAHGESYTASGDVVVPAGFDGPYFLYLLSDLNGTPAVTPGETEVRAGDNDRTKAYYGTHVYERLDDLDNDLRG